MINPAYLPELSERVAEGFLEDYNSIIENIYARGLLDDFLEMTGLKYLKNIESETPKIKTNKKIVVIGQKCGGSKNDYIRAIHSVGLSENSVELHLDYKDGKTINVDKYKNNPNYGAILFGPVPHSGKSKGEFNSVIDRVRREPGFPTVICLGGQGLKLTTSSLKAGLAEVLSEITL